MAWEWSHTTEAYENARLNLNEIGNLAEVYAEIKCFSWDKENAEKENAEEDLSFNNGQSDKFLLEAKGLAKDELAEFIWEFACDHATCDNGGFNAHICPYGCHSVPFDRDEEESEGAI